MVDVLVEAEEIADDAAIEEGAVGVGVGEVGGRRFLCRCGVPWVGLPFGDGTTKGRFEFHC